MTTSLFAPEPMHAGLGVSAFDCGVPELNSWLQRRALKAEGRSARTYASADESAAVGGYYCLSAAAVARADLPKANQRNMPDPAPVVLLGRLAVDLRYAGRGFGGALLCDAIERTLAAAEHIGCRALMVQALNDQGMNFYARFGFVSGLARSSRTLFLPLDTLRAAAAGG